MKYIFTHMFPGYHNHHVVLYVVTKSVIVDEKTRDDMKRVGLFILVEQYTKKKTADMWNLTFLIDRNHG